MLNNPQDFEFLNDVKEKLEEVIDYFHRKYPPWTKPKTYRRRARKEYLAMARQNVSDEEAPDTTEWTVCQTALHFVQKWPIFEQTLNT